MSFTGMPSVMQTITFDPTIGSLHDRVSSKCRRNKNDRYVSSRFIYCFFTELNTGRPGAPDRLFRGNTTHHIGAVFNHLPGVESAF